MKNRWQHVACVETRISAVIVRAAEALERVYCVVERFMLSKDILSFINYDWYKYIRRYVGDRAGIYIYIVGKKA